jgi:hypothetical protein
LRWHGCDFADINRAAVVTRDETVKRHPARHEQIDKARDEVSRSTVALDHAAHNLAALQIAQHSGAVTVPFGSARQVFGSRLDAVFFEKTELIQPALQALSSGWLVAFAKA